MYKFKNLIFRLASLHKLMQLVDLKLHKLV